MSESFPLIFRPCNVEDVPAIKSLSDEVFPNMYPDSYYMMQATDSDKFYILGCFSTTELLAYIVVMKDFVRSDDAFSFSESDRKMFLSFDDSVACITTFGVRKSQRRRHIGSFLMSQILYYLQQLEVKAVYLNVNTDNAGAIKLYTNYGFTCHRLVKNYYIHQPNEFESSDAYLMLRLVKEAPESSYQISSVWLTICCYILDKCLY